MASPHENSFNGECALKYFELWGMTFVIDIFLFISHGLQRCGTWYVVESQFANKSLPASAGAIFTGSYNVEFHA
jgi:hypothetical protein